jgi:hypothetical protein
MKNLVFMRSPIGSVDIQAQYRWAHLLPNIRFPSEKNPDQKIKAQAGQLVDRSRRLFSARHRRDETNQEGFHRSMLTHRDRFLELVRKPPSTEEEMTLAARFAVVEHRRWLGTTRIKATNNRSGRRP